MIGVAPNSAYWLMLQADNVNVAELIDLELPGAAGKYHFTTCNQPITYTLSGATTSYIPFAGGTSGMKADNKLSVANTDFTFQNTLSAVSGLLQNNDFANAVLKIGRVHVSTPNLGRMEIYVGQVGDFIYSRTQVKGQARNIWKSMSIQFPYFLYSDVCVWKFGSTGCGVNVASLTYNITSVNVGSSTTIALLCASGMITRSFSNGRFNFGKLYVTAGVNSGAVRTIMTQTGDLVILVNNLASSDFTGITLQIKPGCRKAAIADCTSLYNNAKNFVGAPGIPIQELVY
jgi:hypothetical protein